MSRDSIQLQCIRCDAPDCREEFVSEDGELWWDVIGDAILAGWDLGWGKPDLCPDHYGTVIP